MIVKIKDKLKNVTINYSYLLQDWVNLFSPSFLEGEYMSNLMTWLYCSFNDNTKVIRPSQRNIFLPFIKCDYKTVTTIIVTEFPSSTYKGSGLGIGNSALISSPSAYTPELKQMQKCIEDTCYKGLNLNFDATFEKLAAQNVLLLNTALTCTLSDNSAHVKHWEPFITETLKELSTKNSNLVFAFIGKACKFSKYIDNDFHTVLIETQSIDEAVKEGDIWMSDIFNEINDALWHEHGTQNSMLTF